MIFPLISGAQAYPHLAILSFIKESSLFSQSKLLFFQASLLSLPSKPVLKCVGYKKTIHQYIADSGPV